MMEKAYDVNGVNGERVAQTRSDAVVTSSVDDAATPDVARQTSINDSQASVTVEEADTSGLPIDRGWAWVVLAACTFEITVYGGMMRSFGVFFLQYQMRFQSNASQTAITNLIQNLVLSVTALFVMTIGLQRFSSRVAVCAGGLLTVIGYVISAYATDIAFLYFGMGVLGGAGLALIHPPMLAIIGAYFNRHRGLANSIFTAGGSLGGLIWPSVVVRLFEEYGYSGAMLIVSGMLMNILVAGVLMRPLELFQKECQRRAPANNSDELISDDLHGRDLNNDKRSTLLESFDDTPISIEETHGLIVDATVDLDHVHGSMDNLSKKKARSIIDITGSITDMRGSKTNLNGSRHNVNGSTKIEFMRMKSYDPEIGRYVTPGSPMIERIRRPRTISESGGSQLTHRLSGSKSQLSRVIDAVNRSKVAIYTSDAGLCGSFLDLNIDMVEKAKSEVDVRGDNVSEKSDKACCLPCRSCVKDVMCTVFDVSLLKNPLFLVFLLMAFCTLSGVGLVPVYVPTHAKDVGLTNQQIGVLISITAATDLVAKILFGFIADRKWIQRPVILASTSILLGTACHLARYMTNFITVLIFTLIAGVCCGQYISMYAILLMDVIGVDKFKQSLGFGTLVHGVSVAIFFPVAGLLRDYTGSYVSSFHLVGGLAYIGAFLVVLIERLKSPPSDKA
ncbi:monocarboxylate transporter 12-like [Mya arenaria]|uniref:monocarboxylate transporter 12-like n=1 Tax=Mya arenaria TaxID=6604 RepID=UPI0022E4C6DE|nr:monocarboxylate transporter 12-like [Mya arenaria]